MRYLRPALVVLISVALLAADKKDAKPKPDGDLIQGTWKVVSVVEDGKKQPADQLKGVRVVITLRTIEFKKEGAKDGLGMEYKLDPSKSPKVFDTSHELDPGKPIIQLGIYSLQGDTLRLCIAGAGAPRPKKLAGADHFVLQRVVGSTKVHPQDLLPRNTIAYAELREPGEIVKELAALLKGSVLDGFPESLAKLGKKYPDMPGFGLGEIAILGLITAPELLDEISRIEGAAVAVTGVDKEDRDMPEFVAFIRPGESNIPGFMFRMFVATFSYGYSYSDGKVRREMRAGVEPIAEVEGVQLYRVIRRQTVTQLDKVKEMDEQNTETTVRPDGPAMARLHSGMILIGTPDRLKDVIRRAKGRNSGPSLASLPAFQEARREIGDRPGLFSFGNPAAALSLAEQVISPRERELLTLLRDLLNPKAVRGVANSVTVENGTFKYRWLARLDAKEKSPPLELLPAKPLNTDLLHFAPRDALLVAAVSNADGGKRWAKVLELADEVTKKIVSKLLPDVRVPPASRLIAATEGVLGFKIGDDVLAKVEAVGLAVPPGKRIKELITDPTDIDIQPPLVLLIRASDEAAAKRFAEEILPEVVGASTLQFGLKAEMEKHGKLTLYTLPLGKRAPTLVYGHHASTLVVGVHPALVAECLTAGASQQGFLADADAKAAVKRAGEPVGLIVAKPLTMASLALSVAFVSSESVRVGPDGKVIERKRVGPKIIWSDESDPMLKRLKELLKSEQPLVVALRRQPDQIMAEATYPGLRKLVPKLTDFAIDGALRYWSDSSRGHGRSSNRTDGIKSSSGTSRKPSITKRDQLVNQHVMALLVEKDPKEIMKMLDVPFYNGMDVEQGVITKQSDLANIDLLKASKAPAPKIDEFHIIVWRKTKEGVDLRIKSLSDY